MYNFRTFQDVPYKVALIGNFLPRKCGIATFTTDLSEAISKESQLNNCYVVAINDVMEGYEYPERVRFEVQDFNLSDYKLAADFLNVNRVSAVCVQHEYGIYGGSHGSYVLTFLRSLRMPVVTTLHTVLSNPEQSQKLIMKELDKASDMLVVMSDKAVEILSEIYGINTKNIKLIHHGIPDLPFVDPNYFKDLFGVEGRKVIMTFGLLSPNKGIEYMIDALPAITRNHPEIVYIILGATHPLVKKEQGESYRISLQRRAKELGVKDHVLFYDRFVELKKLCEFLGAADIYVTPYLNKEQIVSGTLAYAMGAGKPCISTPYWYAEEMLSDGKGRIVPFRDSEALAEQVIDLLENEVELHSIRKRAYSFCRKMTWKEVAREYLSLFKDVENIKRRHPKPAFGTKSFQSLPTDMPQLKLDHLIRLTDDVGILQHSKFMVPDRNYGYSIDDNSRALIAMLMAQELLPSDTRFTDLECIYLSFINYAFDESTGRFRNFMSYDRRWEEKVGSPDSHGRTVWSLGLAVATADSTNLSGVAMDLFQKALPALLDLEYPRSWAFALVGINAYLDHYGGDREVKRIRGNLACRLYDLFLKNTSPEWPWIEDVVTYANGKIPQALLVSGRGLQRDDMIEAGLQSLKWLMKIQTDEKGYFTPVGNRGWYPRGGEKASFDQQPLEAQGMLEACIEAYKLTEEEKWIEEAHKCLEWFLGRNDMETPLYDYKTGGCCDGLQADGPNRNQGAESTLAWLLSLLYMNSLESYQASKSVLSNKAEALNKTS